MNTIPRPAYGLTVTLGSPFDEAVGRVKETFKEEGFGVLTEMNIQGRSRRRSECGSIPTPSLECVIRTLPPAPLPPSRISACCCRATC